MKLLNFAKFECHKISKIKKKFNKIISTPSQFHQPPQFISCEDQIEPKIKAIIIKLQKFIFLFDQENWL